MNNDDEKKIGACWLKESKKGNKYINGCIEIDNNKKIYFVMFKNRNKTKDTQPDYILLRSGDDN
jgi:hypothetical protein